MTERDQVRFFCWLVVSCRTGLGLDELTELRGMTIPVMLLFISVLWREDLCARISNSPR